jgi:glycosyltransferase involved in cell wall biosynthesis
VSPQTPSSSSHSPAATASPALADSRITNSFSPKGAGKGAGLVKVLHLINGEHFSGAERVQDLLGMALPEFGFEAGFACVKPKKFPEVRNAVECELFNTEMKSKLDFGCAGRVAKVARDNDYRLIHAHTPRTLLIGQLAAKKLGCPLVYHVHSPVGRDSERGFSNRINTMIEKWSLKKVDRMICVSSSLAGYMAELGHPKSKIVVVSNGVQAIQDLPKPEQPTEPWTIGTMALFRPRKGTEVLLNALAILKQENVSVRLRAVGPFETPEYENDIMRQVQQLGVGDMIDWMGFQTDVNQQLRNMDLFVLPSLYGEGLPMVVLESMANAIPVVASRVEGIPEAVRDGMDGLIFEPGDAQDLANKLRSMIGDCERWKAMSASAVERQRTELSDLSMARGVAEVYESLLS